MSNQIVISSGAKLRGLNGVITGTTGVLDSVPLGAANGVATLDSSGKVPVSQLPSSVVTYLGTWNAATNTPTLANGTGDAGDMYLCNVAGTVNFGAGPITFAVGDWVLYGSGTWQKSNGQNGTVTSVAVTESGDALNITGSPITTSGTINIGFAGTSAQYVAGDGSLITFPSVVSEAQNLITEVYNETGATLTKGTVVYINGGHGNLPTVTKAQADSEINSAQTYGLVRADITNNNNGYVTVAGRLSDLDTQAFAGGTTLYLSPSVAGGYTSTKPTSPDHIVYVGVVVRSHPTQGVIEVNIQNTQELKESSDVLITSPTNNQGLFYDSATSLWKNNTIATALGYTPANAALVVPYTGATNSLYMGSSYLVSAKAFVTSGSSGDAYLKLLNSITAATPESDGVKLSSVGSVDLVISSNSYNSTLVTSGNTANRTYTFPNTSGTLALTSNLSAYVPYTGATADVDLGAYNLKANSFNIPSAGSTNQLTSFANTSNLFSGSAGLNVFGFNVSNNIYFGKGATNGGVILWNNTQVRYYTLPDADGTVALTSNLSAYLPLTGGTLTGALNGTSATFSGVVTLNAYGNQLKIGSNGGTDGFIGIGSGQSNLFIGDYSSATKGLTISTSTGAATFSSSVTGKSYSVVGTNGYSGQIIQQGDIFGTAATNLLIQSSTGNGIGFLTNGGTTFNMFITSAGNVGIGTSSPNGKLNVVGSNGVIANFVGASSNYGQIYSDTNAAIFGASTSTSLGINYIYINPSSNFQAFITNDNERMRITSGGLVAVNSSTVPNGQMYINGASNSDVLSLQNTLNTGAYLVFADIVTPTWPNAPRLGAISNDMVFKTLATERMRITSGGNVLIGYTGASSSRLVSLSSTNTSSSYAAAFGNSSAADLLLVRGDGLIMTGTSTLSPYNFTTGTGANMVVDSSGYLYRSTSSLKYKTNVTDYDKGLDIINKIRPVYYNSKNNGDILFAGLIAEDIHELGLTEFVQYAEDGSPDALSYSNMVALLIKGIQEQQKQIEELKAKIK